MNGVIMNDKLINIKVRIEGFSETKFIHVKLKEGSCLTDLLSQLIAIYGDEIEPYLYDSITGELAVYSVIINSKLYRLKDESYQELFDNDSVFFISPLGGG